jgi:hypothetical protein
MTTSLHAHLLAAHCAPKYLTGLPQRYSEERFEAIFGEDNRVATQSKARRMQKLLVAEVENKKFAANWGRGRQGSGRPKEAKDTEENIDGHATEATFLQNMHQSYPVFPCEFLPGFIDTTFRDCDTVAPGVAVIMIDDSSQSVMMLPHEALLREASSSPDLDAAAGQAFCSVLMAVAREGRVLAAKWDKEVYSWTPPPKQKGKAKPEDPKPSPRPSAPVVDFNNPQHVFALQCIQAKYGQEVLNFYPATATEKRGTPAIRLDDMAVVLTYLASLDCKEEAWLTPLKQVRPKLATLKSLLTAHFKKRPSSPKVADSRKLCVWYTEVATYCYQATAVDAHEKDDDEEDKESVEDGLPSDSSGTDETSSDEKD